MHIEVEQRQANYKKHLRRLRVIFPGILLSKGKILTTNYYARSIERKKVFSVSILGMDNKIRCNYGNILSDVVGKINEIGDGQRWSN